MKIGDTVTFANELIYINGNVMHEKGEKAVIRDIEYTGGYWSRLCPDIWVEKKPSGIKLVGLPNVVYTPDTFEEFKIERK